MTTTTEAPFLDHVRERIRAARAQLEAFLALPAGAAARFRAHINGLTTARAQLDCVRDSFDAWAAGLDALHHLPQEEWKLAA